MDEQLYTLATVDFLADGGDLLKLLTTLRQAKRLDAPVSEGNYAIGWCSKYSDFPRLLSP